MQTCHYFKKCAVWELTMKDIYKSAIINVQKLLQWIGVFRHCWVVFWGAFFCALKYMNIQIFSDSVYIKVKFIFQFQAETEKHAEKRKTGALCVHVFCISCLISNKEYTSYFLVEAAFSSAILSVQWMKETMWYSSVILENAIYFNFAIISACRTVAWLCSIRTDLYSSMCQTSVLQMTASCHWLGRNIQSLFPFSMSLPYFVNSIKYSNFLLDWNMPHIFKACFLHFVLSLAIILLKFDKLKQY